MPRADVGLSAPPAAVRPRSGGAWFSSVARRWPSGGEIVWISILGLLLFSNPSYLFSDGGTGWHVVTGRTILAHRAVPHVEFLSYTFAGRPWVAFEWLADAIFAAFESVGGMPALAVACASAIGLLFWVLHRDMRSAGCPALLALVLVCAGAIASSVHWLARPHLFTYFAVYALARVLGQHWSGRLGTRGLALAVAAIMLAWTNLHPAFPLGLVMIAVFLGCAALRTALGGAGRASDPGWGPVRDLTLALVLAAAATFINPYGWRLHAYIARHLGDPVLRATEEFSPPALDGSLQTTCFFVLLALFAAGLVWRPRAAAAPKALVALLIAGLALRGVRHVPLFVIVVLPVLAEIARDRGTAEAPSFVEKPPLAAILLTALLLVISIAGGPVREQLLSRCGFDPLRFPSTTLRWLRDHRAPPEHGLAWDDWGGFIAYRLGFPVFIDDRSDFFPREFTRDYIRISAATSGTAALLDRYGIDWVLYPRAMRLSRFLEASPRWRLVEEDPAARLFVRR